MPQAVAFVTGASTGIGFETAKKLASAGFTVYAGARRVEKMEPLKASGVKVMALDVTDEDSMSAAVGEVLAAHGGSTSWSTTPATGPTVHSRRWSWPRGGDSST